MRLTDGLVGRLVGGRFRLGRLIHDARLCGTYEAHDIETRQSVAIEILSARRCGGTPAPAKLRKATRQLVATRHSGLCWAQSVGMEGGVPFIVSAPVSGESLGCRIARSGPLSVADTLSVTLQVIDAMAAAHAAGLIHGNLKPEKITVTAAADGSLVATVMGLGVATLLGTMPDVDARGVGTPPYLAPEQLTGFVAADELSDVWGIGLLMFEMLTAQRAFDGRTADEVGRRIALGSPANVCRLNPQVPVSLGLIVRAVLARARSQRLSLSDLRHALVDVVAEHKAQPPPVAAAIEPASAREVIFDLTDPCDDVEGTTDLHLIIDMDLASV